MTVYVQGASALAYYRTGYAEVDVQQCSQSVRNLRGATSSRSEIREMGIGRLGIGEPSPERPLEVLVRKASQRSRSQVVHARVWSGEIPRTAFRQVGKGLYVSSPEFVFLQMATRLDLPQLVALGMELCGTYRRNVELAHLGSNESGFETVYHVQPLTTPKRLQGFLGSVGSAAGVPTALKALDYVLPNSASPMETVLYLLLCLPRRLGGYALPKPVLNPSIVLSKAGRRYTVRNVAKPDLLWEHFRLDLEYDSDEFHGNERLADGSMRRKALERMQIEVVQLTAEEVLSTDLFHATALRLARRFGKRVRAEHEGGFVERRAQLRASLLEADPTRPPLSGEERGAGEEPTDLCGHVSSPLDAEEAVWVDAFVATDEPLPDAESPFDLDDDWGVEIRDVDDDWQVDDISWSDEDLHVYGGNSYKDERG